METSKMLPLIALFGLAFVIVMGAVFSFNMYYALDNESGNANTSALEQSNAINYTWIYIIAAILVVIFVSMGLAIAKGWLFA